MTAQLKPISRVREELASTSAIGQRLKIVAAARAEETLAELPKLARRFATLLLVLSIAIPVIVILLVALLWYLVF